MIEEAEAYKLGRQTEGVERACIWNGSRQLDPANHTRVGESTFFTSRSRLAPMVANPRSRHSGATSRKTT
ncbi:MAG: hypothetical protein QXS12_03330, partial [Candidatus Caldarchaeum sp.]